jgi:hypothetical protein
VIGFGASAGGGELDRFLAVSLAVVLSNAALHKLSIVFVQRSSRWDNRVVHYPRLLRPRMTSLRYKANTSFWERCPQPADGAWRFIGG